MTSNRKLLCSALLALALTGSVTACGGSDDKAGDKAGDKSSASAGGSTPSGQASDGSSAGGGVKITKDVPEDFPASDVPLLSGKVLGGSEGAFLPNGDPAKGWIVRLKEGGSAQSAVSAAKAKLTGAGFTNLKEPNPEQGALKSDDYRVWLRAAKLKGGGAVLIYTVVPR